MFILFSANPSKNPTLYRLLSLLKLFWLFFWFGFFELYYEISGEIFLEAPAPVRAAAVDGFFILFCDLSKSLLNLPVKAWTSCCELTDSFGIGNRRI